jgi:hypothetical protein
MPVLRAPLRRDPDHHRGEDDQGDRPADRKAKQALRERWEQGDRTQPLASEERDWTASRSKQHRKHRPRDHTAQLNRNVVASCAHMASSQGGGSASFTVPEVKRYVPAAI